MPQRGEPGGHHSFVKGFSPGLLGGGREVPLPKLKNSFSACFINFSGQGEHLFPKCSLKEKHREQNSDGVQVDICLWMETRQPEKNGEDFGKALRVHVKKVFAGFIAGGLQPGLLKCLDVERRAMH